MGLSEYKKKRRFSKTPEPGPEKKKPAGGASSRGPGHALTQILRDPSGSICAVERKTRLTLTEACRHGTAARHAPCSISLAPSRLATGGRRKGARTMKHPSSRALYAYWDKLRAGRAAPERFFDEGALGWG